MRLELSPQFIEVWTGDRDVNILGGTFLGAGSFASVEGIGGDQNLRANDISVGLHGLVTSSSPQNVVKKLRTTKYQRRALTLYAGTTDPDTDLPDSTPFSVWRGKADVMTLQIGTTMSIILTGEHLSSALRKSNALRMNNESHIARVGDANDRFFEFNDRLVSQPKAI